MFRGGQWTFAEGMWIQHGSSQSMTVIPRLFCSKRLVCLTAMTALSLSFTGHLHYLNHFLSSLSKRFFFVRPRVPSLGESQGGRKNFSMVTWATNAILDPPKVYPSNSLGFPGSRRTGRKDV
jgi:hypothetical protein